MARIKFQTLTEQMFYTLLCLRQECCGTDVMERVRQLTSGRVSVGPGTLYSLLDSFLQAGMIRETRVEGRKRSYLITEEGRKALEEEYRRLLSAAGARKNERLRLAMEAICSAGIRIYTCCTMKLNSLHIISSFSYIKSISFCISFTAFSTE